MHFRGNWRFIYRIQDAEESSRLKDTKLGALATLPGRDFQ